MGKSLWVLASLLVVAPTTAVASAEAGTPAPDVRLMDSRGTARSLSEFHGKIVVLEWWNPDCPFVKRHYGGAMQRLQDTYTARGVIWLMINSSAPGKQGRLAPEAANTYAATHGVKATAMLLDPDGAAGRLYGAKTTPHMFIIDPQGTLAYAGAIDDHPAVDPSDPPPASNYVTQSLEALLAGRPIPVRTTTSYGCSVKY
ncbi:MAG: thioredoxin family protein [Candidatus Omnitrophica bacterium]|nr:thioredoxin family protein [Candidatus Omnitrophota bacterium]